MDRRDARNEQYDVFQSPPSLNIRADHPITAQTASVDIPEYVMIDMLDGMKAKRSILNRVHPMDRLRAVKKIVSQLHVFRSTRSGVMALSYEGKKTIQIFKSRRASFRDGLLK